MTLCACLNHSPMHVFGKGYVCANCGIPVYFTATALDIAKSVVAAEIRDARAVSVETQKALDDIDANILSAAIRAKDTFLD